MTSCLSHYVEVRDLLIERDDEAATQLVMDGIRSAGTDSPAPAHEVCLAEALERAARGDYSSAHTSLRAASQVLDSPRHADEDTFRQGCIELQWLDAMLSYAEGNPAPLSEIAGGDHPAMSMLRREVAASYVLGFDGRTHDTVRAGLLFH